MLRCLGIYREHENSPGRVSDDARVLDAVLARMRESGVVTRAIEADESDELDLASWDLVLPMCEDNPRLLALVERARRVDARWVNHPEHVLGCYRTRLVPTLLACRGVAFPPSELRRVADGPGDPPAGFAAPEGWWVKRGDVHNATLRDVVRAAHWEDVGATLADFAQRGIRAWVVQPHLAGDLVKFYGVGPGRWFTWFHHDPERSIGIPFEAQELAAQAARAAAAVGLEVYGGDAIVSPGGACTLIDLNSWPSCARVRAQAAAAIASHLLESSGLPSNSSPLSCSDPS